LTAGGPRTTVLIVLPRFAVQGVRAVGGWGACVVILASACASSSSFYENDPVSYRNLPAGPSGYLGGDPPRDLPAAGAPSTASTSAPSEPVAAPDIDIPCSAGPQALLPALEARIMHRIRPPVGLVPLSVAGTRNAGGLQVKVVMEIDKRGTIRRSAVASSSGIGELDRAVLRAIDEAACMPVPSRALLDERSGSFKVSLGYLFARGGQRPATGPPAEGATPAIPRK
jgi:TonB family protein